MIVASRAAYGSESLFNSLRLAIALRDNASELDLRIFFDVRRGHRRSERPKTGRGLQHSADAEILTAQNVPVKLCKTCTDRRGITGLPLIEGVEIGTLVELAEWTLDADKVLTF
ncbi:DsrE family protein [Enterobacter cloacae subsp. cloacae]|nr:DsrE family protein [Enterobacter cloacae subsp. cloacae]